MAGVGSAPKDPSKRARRNADPIPHTVLPLQVSAAPPLPDSMEWHPETRRWWGHWQSSPLSGTFTVTDWDFLLETARLHTMFWNGNPTVAAELRLRVAKFGATPEDRARLRIFFADATKKEKDTGSTTAPQSAPGYTGPRLVT